MPFIEEEPKYSSRTLWVLGVPSFVLAVFVSLLSRHYVYLIANQSSCGTLSGEGFNLMTILSAPHPSCPFSSAAGMSWTFVLALVSFALYMRFPRNLFLGAMAFVNASIRIPATLTVLLQLVSTNRARLVADESASLSLLRLSDPTVAVLLLCFFMLTISALTLTIVHDTKTVRWKWPVAAALFLALGPLQQLPALAAHIR